MTRAAILAACLALAGCGGEVSSAQLEQADRFGGACHASGRTYDECKSFCWDEYGRAQLYGVPPAYESCTRAVRRELLQTPG